MGAQSPGVGAGALPLSSRACSCENNFWISGSVRSKLCDDAYVCMESAYGSILYFVLIQRTFISRRAARSSNQTILHYVYLTLTRELCHRHTYSSRLASSIICGVGFIKSTCPGVGTCRCRVGRRVLYQVSDKPDVVILSSIPVRVMIRFWGGSGCCAFSDLLVVRFRFLQHAFDLGSAM